MEFSAYTFIRFSEEGERANELAYQHAASILTDLSQLSPGGRRLMVERLVDLISEIAIKGKPDKTTTKIN